MLLYLSATDRDHNLKLTTNRTAACLDDYYYLLCVSRKPFGDICHYQTVDWYHGTVRIVNSSKYIISEPSATERVLKFLITEDEFREPQNFSCKAISCMSNVVSVGKYSEFKSGTHVGLYLVQQAMHEAPLCTYNTYGIMLHAVKSYNEYCVCM